MILVQKLREYWNEIGVILLVTGLIDIDWMVVAPRFNTWYYTVDYWEFFPFFRCNWWLAYALSICRVVMGAYIIGRMKTV